MNLRNLFRKNAPATDPRLIDAFCKYVDVVRQAQVPPAQMIGLPSGAARRPWRQDNGWNYSFPHNPKRHPGSILSVEALKVFAEQYDVLRSCIMHLKRETWATKAAFTPKDPAMSKDRAAALIKQANEFFSEYGGLGGAYRRRTHFEGELVEDLCTVGASAVYLGRTRGGVLLSAECIDSSTIRPVVDAYGWSPDKPYEQWAMGAVVAQFSPDEIIYDGLYSMTNTPYFKSPIEYLLSVLTMAVKSDEWNRNLLTNGKTLRDVLTFPDTWQPPQVSAFIELMRVARELDPMAPTMMPGGSQRLGARMTMDKEFADLDMWLLRRTCSMFGVQPAAIGYSGEQYKVSQDASMDQTTEFGAGAVIEFRNSIYNRLLVEIGCGELECSTKVNEPTEAPKDKADRVIKLTGKPVLTINEGRAELGLDPIDGGDVLQEPQPEPVEPAPQGNQKDDDNPKDDGRLERVEAGWKPTPERRKKAFAKYEAAQKLLTLKGDKLIEAFVEDSMTAESMDEALQTFAKQYASAVLQGHIQAAQSGAILTNLPKATATEIGKAAGVEQKSWIDKFISEIKPEVLFSEEVVLDVASKIQKAHLPLYVNGLTGTANEAAVKGIPEGTPIHWKEDPGAEHCRDCPGLAAMGPYTPESMPCYPGDGFTECGTNCKCGLYLDDGTYVSIHDWTKFSPENEIEEREDALRKWEKKALSRLKRGQLPACSFESDALDSEEVEAIKTALEEATYAEAVKKAFRR